MCQTYGYILLAGFGGREMQMAVKEWDPLLSQHRVPRANFKHLKSLMVRLSTFSESGVIIE